MRRSPCMKLGLLTLAAGVGLGFAPPSQAQIPDSEGAYCTSHPFDNARCVPPVPGVAPSVPIRPVIRSDTAYVLPTAPQPMPQRPQTVSVIVLLPTPLPFVSPNKDTPPPLFDWPKPAELPKPKPEEPIPAPTHFSNNAPAPPSVLWVPPSTPAPGNSPTEVAARRAMILSMQQQEQEEQGRHAEAIKEQHAIAAKAMIEMREFYPEIEKFAKGQEKLDGENLIRANWSVERDGFCRENSGAHYLDLNGRDQMCQ